ncbi:YaiI/YqxD family protein [Metallumcola ferriviriculae]|uniref:UPF0178 protein MFMK1_001132 n=1 Tax=Metallumcola ferriviriculae TaxID=3039180 RepID=A0AAU0UMD5_9FIRM|nr:YaiI/YqxD family protein [Desulfitibacteraceae bacterium MK1]
MFVRIFIDGDACPVKAETVSLADEYKLEVILVASVSHHQHMPGVKLVQVDNMPEAADIAIVNRLEKGDIVVTQDYGLASLVLAKGALALSPRGKDFNHSNIDILLTERHMSAKVRRAGGRTKGPAPFTTADKERFASALRRLIEGGY